MGTSASYPYCLLGPLPAETGIGIGTGIGCLIGVGSGIDIGIGINMVVDAWTGAGS
jgi:hypothetical protein